MSLPGATSVRVTVAPGDFIIADDDGAIAIPAAVVERTLDRAEAIGAKEKEIRSDIAAGLSLADALGKYGHV